MMTRHDPDDLENPENLILPNEVSVQVLIKIHAIVDKLER